MMTAPMTTTMVTEWGRGHIITNLWSDAFLAGKGVISTTMMTTATTITKTRGYFDNDDTRKTTKKPTERKTTT